MSLRGSYGSRENSKVLIASGPPMLTPSVDPSGAAFATISVPRLPLAPGLFSTRNALPGYFCCRPSTTRRATISGVDPGPNGTTTRTVLVGQSWAATAALSPRDRKSAAIRRFANRYIAASVTKDVPRGKWLALIAAILYLRRQQSVSVSVWVYHGLRYSRSRPGR